MKFLKQIINETMDVYRIEETPFVYVTIKEEKRNFIAIGNEIITDVKNMQEAEEIIKEKPWTILVPAIGAIVNKVLETEKGMNNGNNTHN